MQKGYTQIYTGNGKGKTTAALGLITRAVGSNFKIFLSFTILTRILFLLKFFLF